MIRVLLAIACLARVAHADGARYAVVIGNNQGDRDEVTLRYAERDAERFANVLLDVGGFSPQNIVTLLASDADTVRATLIAVNDRIRNEQAGSAMITAAIAKASSAKPIVVGKPSRADRKSTRLNSSHRH